MGVLVGQKTPDFTASAVLANGDIIDNFNFHSRIKGKYGLLFFYPLDFTFVCPSELIALDHRMPAFQQRNVEVVGISIDSQFSHNAWRNTPIDKGGIGALNYSLVADLNHNITKAYDVESQGGVAFRGAFIIDDKAMVRAQIVNDLPIGRDIDEILRIIDAVQFTAEHGEVCPAGWKKDKPGMQANPQGVADYLSKNATKL